MECERCGREIPPDSAAVVRKFLWKSRPFCSRRCAEEFDRAGGRGERDEVPLYPLLPPIPPL